MRLLRCNFIMSVLLVRACLETVASLWYQLQCVMFRVPALMPAFYSKYELDHGLDFQSTAEFSKPGKDLLHRNRVGFGNLDNSICSLSEGFSI